MSETPNDGRVTVDHMSNGEDAVTAFNVITMLLSRGKEPEEVMAALAMGLAVFNTIVSPDEEARDANTAGTEQFVRKAQVEMWPERDKLDRMIRSRVEHISPFAMLLEAIGGKKRGGGDTRPKQPEPEAQA